MESKTREKEDGTKIKEVKLVAEKVTFLSSAKEKNDMENEIE